MPPTSRRDFLAGAAGALASPSLAAPSGKAPFKVLFSNDTTNILSCASPYHKPSRGTTLVPGVWFDRLTDDMIRATVDEADGADAHLFQPGFGWIPWWKSKVYPAGQHYRNWMRATGLKPDGFGQYMLDGGDMVKTFVDRCRQKGQAPFVSLRMNDGHLQDNVGTKSQLSAYSCRFYEEHPEYRLGKDMKVWGDRVHNWAIPEAREYKFAFVRELCENYDLDGFELDFMRYPALFRQNETTSARRAEIMTAFIARCRQLLDRTARKGHRRWLCARIPCFQACYDAMGIDLPAMVRAGLDMVDLSGYYFTIQQTDLAAIRKQIPQAAVYLEQTHSIRNGPRFGNAALDNFTFMRTTEPHYYTGAHLAYEQGADGISLFNFVYYRTHGPEGRGPFNEPPFHVLKRLKDRAWLAKQPQWYVLGESSYTPRIPRPLPAKLQAGEERTFHLAMAPRDGFKRGLFRLKTEADSSQCEWFVKLNDTPLEKTGYVAKPIDHPYKGALGEPNQYACFDMPVRLVRKGGNDIVVKLARNGPANLEMLDVALT